MGDLGSRTRSRGQINEKPCEDDRGHIFHQTFMKIGQNGCLDKIWLKIVYGSCQVNEKPCVDDRGHIFHQIFMKSGANVCLD